ncbi:MAG: hypothetical protein H7Z21_07855, partial [Hymenobacter sp.]|nr:hypothetical protein [Hymenobacter sp.]
TTYATSQEPLIIRIAGTISGGAEGAAISVKSDKTLLGVGSAGLPEGVGLNLSSQHNIIIQNLRFTMSAVTRTAVNGEGCAQVVANDGDCITIQDPGQQRQRVGRPLRVL